MLVNNIKLCNISQAFFRKIQSFCKNEDFCVIEPIFRLIVHPRYPQPSACYRGLSSLLSRFLHRPKHLCALDTYEFKRQFLRCNILRRRYLDLVSAVIGFAHIEVDFALLVVHSELVFTEVDAHFDIGKSVELPFASVIGIIPPSLTKTGYSANEKSCSYTFPPSYFCRRKSLSNCLPATKTSV